MFHRALSALAPARHSYAQQPSTALTEHKGHQMRQQQCNDLQSNSSTADTSMQYGPDKSQVVCNAA